MSQIKMDVNVVLPEIPVNMLPLVDDTDFKTIEDGVVYNQAGLDLNWNFTTTDGLTTQTNVTPTTASGSDYEWVNQGNGMYSIAAPDTGGASINNDAEGFGWYSGVADGVLPWRGPIITFRAAALNNALIDGGDVLDVNVTAMASNVVTAAAIAVAAIDNATFAADVGSTAYATNIIALAVRKALDEIKLDHLIAVADADDPVNDSIIAKFASKSGTADWSSYDNTTDALEAIADKIVAASPQAHFATADTTITGTLNSGSYTDTTSVNSVYIQVSPVGAAVNGFGLNEVLTFIAGTGTDRSPDSVTITGYFDSGALRTVQIWAYDYMAAGWVQLSNSANDFGNAGSNQSFGYSLTANMIQVSDGEIQIRATSTSTNIGDEWFWDFVEVNSVAVEAAGLTADSIQQAVWSRDDENHDEHTLGYNVSAMHLVHGVIVSATDAIQFVIDFDIPENDIYDGMVITLEDKTDGHYETRRIVSTIAASNEIIVDRVFGFTPVAGDDYYILNNAYANSNVTHVSGTAQTANDNGADINAILVDTNELQTDWTNDGRLDLIIDAILEDTSTTIQALIATAQADLDTITGAAGALLDSTATSAQLVDDIWDEVLTGMTHNISNSAGKRLRDLQELGGYALGSVWIDTENGEAGNDPFINGTEVNPVDNLADAISIATTVGLFKYEIANGSTITLTAPTENYVFRGHGWSIVLGEQSISGTHFRGAFVSGIGSGAVLAHFDHCYFYNCTIPTCIVHDSIIAGKIIAAAATVYHIHDSTSIDSGAIFDFSAAIGNTSLHMPNWSGDIEIQNMGQTGTDEAFIHGGGNITFNTNCVGGVVDLYGNIIYTNNGSGIVINDDARFNNNADITDILADTNELQGNQGDWATAGGFSTHSATDVRTEMDNNSTQFQAVIADTEDIQSRLPAALVGGKIDADTTAISGSTDAADKLEAAAEVTLTGAAIGGTLSTTQMTTDLVIAGADQLKDRYVVFKEDTTTAALRGQPTEITAVEVAGSRLTFTALTTAMVVGDTFVIV